MHRRDVLGSLAATLSLALAACGGGGGSGGGGGGAPPPPPVITFSHTFPAGDAVAQKGTAWDIVGVTTTLTGQFGSAAGQQYDTLRVDVTFAQDISNALPPPGQSLALGTSAGATQLGVSTAINSDGNTGTGTIPPCFSSGGIKPFEYLTDDVSRISDGNYGIYGPGGVLLSQGGPNPPDEAATSVAGHVLSQTFFLPSIGVASGANVPRIGISVAALNGIDPNATDCVPSGLLEIYTDSPNLQ
jgi:hypothetical protein